jgi:hypothetical protein
LHEIIHEHIKEQAKLQTVINNSHKNIGNSRVKQQGNLEILKNTFPVASYYEVHKKMAALDYSPLLQQKVKSIAMGQSDDEALFQCWYQSDIACKFFENAPFPPLILTLPIIICTQPHSAGTN